MYKALYRKYRPRSFSQIVGQKHVVKTLQNAIEQQKIGHAYLFHGPRGTGKTSIAKIFAEAVNCLAEIGVDKPCHQCDNCLAVDAEQATDIIELDAASNNGVDEIRQIREFARYAPTQLKYKVYIIDEVHMLSTAAFNALLKTLEEPPAHVIFILATTEIHKIPQTIISRCQRFDFKKVTIPEMIECINPILSAENIQISDEGLHYLAEYADGGMRDALSVLDQVSAYTNTEIQLQDIQDVIGTVGENVYRQLVNDVILSDSKAILVTLEDIVASGKNIQLFVEEFLKYLLREIEKNLQGNSEFDARILFFMLEKMNKLAAEMRSAFLPQVALQALFLEITYDSEHDATTQQIIKNENIAQKEVLITREQDPSVSQRVEVMQEPVVKEDLPKIITEETKIALSNLADNQEAIEAQKTINNEEDVITENVKPAEDVLDLFNADNFEELDVQEDYQPQDEFEPEALHLAETKEADVLQQEPVLEPIVMEEITTIFEEIADEDKMTTAAVVKQETNETTVHDQEEKMQELELINDEKRRLLLQRVMAEVVIYPEFNQLEKIKRKWQLIKFDPTNQITIMLLDMEPKIATKKEIVLSSFNKALANQLQLKNKKVLAEAFLSEIIGQEYEIIVIDEALWMQERASFSERWKANEVTSSTIDNLHQEVLTLEEQAAAKGYEYVTLDFDEAENIQEEPIIAEAKELFGADIVEVK